MECCRGVRTDNKLQIKRFIIKSSIIVWELNRHRRWTISYIDARNYAGHVKDDEGVSIVITSWAYLINLVRNLIADEQLWKLPTK